MRLGTKLVCGLAGAAAVFLAPVGEAEACSCQSGSTALANRAELPVGASVVFLDTIGCAEFPEGATVDGEPVQIIYENDRRTGAATLQPPPSTPGQVVEFSFQLSDPIALDVTEADDEPPPAPVVTLTVSEPDPGGCFHQGEVFSVRTTLGSAAEGGTRHWVTLRADGQVVEDALSVRYADEGIDSVRIYVHEPHGNAAELCAEVYAEDASGNVSDAVVECIVGPNAGVSNGDDDSDDDGGTGGGTGDGTEPEQAPDSGDDGLSNRSCSVAGDDDTPAIALLIGLLLVWRRRIDP